MQSIENKIYRIICGHGKGWCFSNKDFSSLAIARTIDSALHRLSKEGKIRRVCRGVYDYPRYSAFLKETLVPDIEQVAQAIARRSGWRIYPEGNVALNLLGISNQVPGRIIYLADGASRSLSYKVGNYILEIKKSSLKEMNLKHYETALLVQALKARGISHITEEMIVKLQSKFSSIQKKRIIRDSTYVTRWIREAIMKICMEETDG